MAQIDTGLGWSAKSDWLFSSEHAQMCQFVKIVAPDFPNQPSPFASYTSTWQERAAIGMIAIDNMYYSGTTYQYRITHRPDVPTFLCIIDYGTYKAFAGISTGWGSYIDRLYYNPIDGSYTRTGTLTATNTQDPTTGLYYSIGATLITAELNGVFKIPVFTDISDALSSISVSLTTYYKLNSGYAVASLVNWITPEGTEQLSPVLISTEESAVKLSIDNTTEYYGQYVYIGRVDGMTFYMSMVLNNGGVLRNSLVQSADLRQFAASAPSKVLALIAHDSFANIEVLETADPYEDFGYTEEEAGEVDPDPDDDDIEEDSLPTTSFADAGFCRIYSPSLSQLDSLSNYLWTDQTFLQTVINHLKQILENPIDAIISLSLVPCVPPTSSSEEVKVMFIPTGVYMPPVTNQFVEIDCGTFALKEMYGSALDYNPYTSVQLYLPYVGIVQLDTDEVMGKVIHVGYRIDVVTGVCCAYVKANDDVLYQFSGHCSIQQPITSADFSGYINAALAAGKLVASIAAAGAGAPEVAASLVGAPTPSVSSSSSDTRTTERNESTGRQITTGTRHRETRTENSGASFGEVAARGISNTVGAVMNSKTIVQHSGGFSGNSGYLAAVRRPYLIVTRPRIANPEKYGEFNGRPSMIYMNLGQCTGYTQVQSIHLTGIDATNPELSEIATLLTSGVIF